MKKLLLFTAIVITAMSCYAKNITGKITDSDGGLLGATISIKGGKANTTSDFDGNYSIEASPEDVIVFSYTGYDTQEIVVGNQTIINVVMQTSLDAVVVVGYSNHIKSKNYAASSTITARPNASVIQRLSGQVAGVHIQNSNGQPGANTSIRVRGMASNNSANQPLIVMNGRMITEKELNSLDPTDISSIEVLKDASATAIYGNRGTNGVILINTENDVKLNEAAVVIHQLRDLFANESYKNIEENEFTRVGNAPLSTFSIDVDKASYSNVRRMINNGQTVTPDAVKIEEMINYFNYDYDQPTGDHPFAVHTAVSKTPWNRETQLVKIGLQGKDVNKDQLPASHLTFLIDVSGSMSDQNKLPLLKSAFKILVQQLREKDKVSIVVYAGAAGIVLKPTSGADKETIINSLENLNAGGSTAGGQGIELAYKVAQENFIKDGNNRVILATDGDFNVGASSDKAMEKLIEEKRKSGVFLSVLGMGYGNYQDSKLETLADKGNGNHAYIDNIQEARKVFGKEFNGSLYTIAKDVKLQVEFNPKNVLAYRLIGYENRLLATEDFIDDTKDAGELGIGHTVTSLYEIIPTGKDSKHLKELTDLKYTDTSFSKDFNKELFTVKLRYKKPAREKSTLMEFIQKNKTTRADDNMQFAAAVAMFGMQLRHSKYYNETTLEDVIQLAKKGKGKDEDGYRAEFIRLVEAYQAYRNESLSYSGN
ncbi:Ca-activated chloride channel family protein [Nonlabens xylanidelens]|uniref:Ca-activated chloride channel family protein n=1 Tax=Nonlabens xylanidelens TaxID=191564 RepID=A0A2S6INN6_9FLAO|nr:VWA domain-containing protein [Nonlabens xylanidelens]PPK95867.1 Ca-activated chloride channel family protein [Nonlabens xylanidelens]PQJ22649.1 VWA domain-containing protein [Nonlabens xylanidelens]